MNILEEALRSDLRTYTVLAMDTATVTLRISADVCDREDLKSLMLSLASAHACMQDYHQVAPYALVATVVLPC